MKSLLLLTHKQWLFRNARKHIKVFDGITEAEHLEIYSHVEEYFRLDPNDLLPKHRYLLEDDFSSMGKLSSIARKVWVLNVEPALAAAKAVRQGATVAEGLVQFQQTTTRPRKVLPSVELVGWRSRSFSASSDSWTEKLVSLASSKHISAIQIQQVSAYQLKSGSVHYRRC